MTLVRTQMTQRTAIERSTSVSDSGGGYNKTWASLMTDVPCRAYSMRVHQPGVTGELGSEIAIGGERTGVIEITGVLMPKNTGVTEGDRLVSITDRKGNVKYTGPMLVDSVGIEPDHVRLTVRRID